MPERIMLSIEPDLAFFVGGHNQSLFFFDFLSLAMYEMFSSLSNGMPIGN